MKVTKKQLGPILRALVEDGRWRRYLALAVAFAIGCGLLSWWQFARRHETAEANALIVANASAPAAAAVANCRGVAPGRASSSFSSAVSSAGAGGVARRGKKAGSWRSRPGSRKMASPIAPPGSFWPFFSRGTK